MQAWYERSRPRRDRITGIDCRRHAPYVPMQKSRRRFCWVCPECGNTAAVDAAHRDYRFLT